MNRFASFVKNRRNRHRPGWRGLTPYTQHQEANTYFKQQHSLNKKLNINRSCFLNHSNKKLISCHLNLWNLMMQSNKFWLFDPAEIIVRSIYKVYDIRLQRLEPLTNSDCSYASTRPITDICIQGYLRLLWKRNTNSSKMD